MEKHTPNVVELSQEMTPAMKEIQSAIVEILKACIDEIKRTNMVFFPCVFCLNKRLILGN